MVGLPIENGTRLLDEFLGNDTDGLAYATILAAIRADQLPETTVVTTRFLNGQGLVSGDLQNTVAAHLQPVPPVQ